MSNSDKGKRIDIEGFEDDNEEQEQGEHEEGEYEEGEHSGEFEEEEHSGEFEEEEKEHEDLEQTNNTFNKHTTQTMQSVTSNDPNFPYTRQEYVFLTKLNERAERYEECIEYAIKYIMMSPVLNREERVVFCSAFRNQIYSKRNSWRFLNSLEKRERKNMSLNLNNNKEKENKSKENTNNTTTKDKENPTSIVNPEAIKEIRLKIEAEINKIVDTIQNLLDDFLIPHSIKPEEQVFYLKLKADYFRYKAEYSVNEEQSLALELADRCYNDAYLTAEEELPVSSTSRLGLALNFSIFYYEQMDRKEDALMIARNMFDSAYKIIEELEKNRAKDAILIIQILKENLILWNNEREEKEQ